MGLNPRLSIACPTCLGRGRMSRFISSESLVSSLCPTCDGSGDDDAAEARLAELVEGLPAVVYDLEYGARNNYLPQDVTDRWLNQATWIAVLHTLLAAGSAPGWPATGSE